MKANPSKQSLFFESKNPGPHLGSRHIYTPIEWGLYYSSHFLTNFSCPVVMKSAIRHFPPWPRLLVTPVASVADTVDGSEIRREIPVEVGSLSHYFQGFSTIPGGARFQPSTISLLFQKPLGAFFAEVSLVPFFWYLTKKNIYPSWKYFNGWKLKITCEPENHLKQTPMCWGSSRVNFPVCVTGVLHHRKTKTPGQGRLSFGADGFYEGSFEASFCINHPGNSI